MERKSKHIAEINITLTERDAHEVMVISDALNKMTDTSLPFFLSIAVTAIAQSLYHTYKNFRWTKNPLKKFSYLYRSRPAYLLKKLSYANVMLLYQMLLELEGVKKKSNNSGRNISRVVIASLISSTLNIPFDEVERRPITQYQGILEQVFNVENFKQSGKVEFETTEDKTLRLTNVYFQHNKKEK